MSGPKPSEPAETGLKSADRGRHPAEPARPVVVQVHESSPFTRKCRRITAQAKTRPFPRGGWGGIRPFELPDNPSYLNCLESRRSPALTRTLRLCLS